MPLLLGDADVLGSSSGLLIGFLDPLESAAVAGSGKARSVERGACNQVRM